MADKAMEDDKLLGDDEASQYAPSSLSATIDDDVEPEKWDDDKYIWDRKELEDINKARTKEDVLPKILRQEGTQFGIRSHPDMTPWKCIKSMFVPWQNEFLSIWIYLIFAIYFWVQLVILAIDTKSVGAINSTDTYDFNNKEDYELMFVATLGICLSLTMTAGYLVFYSIDTDMYSNLSNLNFMGVLTMMYMFTFAWIGSELQHAHYYFYLLFLSSVLLISCLVLLQYEIGRTISIWISAAFLGSLYIIDFIFLSNKHQTETFYVPLILEGLLLLIGVLLVLYRVPERWCKKSKFIQLYCNSYVIFALIAVNIIFELHTILYYTIKGNSNYLDDDYAWWKIVNVYDNDKQPNQGNSTITGN